MTPPRDPADTISAMCNQGKHGRCTGWMTVPNFNKRLSVEDISIKCRCHECKHPEVEPLRHLRLEET